MCGRIGKLDDQETQEWFEKHDPYWRRIKAAYSQGTTGVNIKPTQQVSFVTDLPDEDAVLVGRWGLIPHWVKDVAAFKTLLFNARSEGAADKPSFRDAVRKSRCVVPVSGFYEWKAVEGQAKKQPYWISMSDGSPMLLAGLYSRRRDGDSFTIMTTEPNQVMSEIHNRMPVILDPDRARVWLDASLTDPTALEPLMGACPDEWLTVTPLDKPIEVWEPSAA